MAKLRNISTGVVISFDDALADRFSTAEWESADGSRSRSAATTAAPARRTATKRTAKKAAAKKAAPVEATGSPAAPVADEA